MKFRAVTQSQTAENRCVGLRAVALAVFGTLFCNVFAVADQTNNLPMRFESLTVEEGLAQNSVISIQQDAQGYLWFGTENGLDRYDGYSFRHFSDSRGAVNALPADYVYDIEQASDGSLWIATDGGGVLRWDTAAGAFQPLPLDAVSNGRFYRLAADPRGYLWIGSMFKGLFRLDLKSGEIIEVGALGNPGAELSDDAIRALWLDADGTLWVGTNDGLNRVSADGLVIQQFRHSKNDASSLSNNLIRALLRDHDGTLWVGTKSGGLNRYDEATESFTSFRYSEDERTSISSNRVEAILEDDARRLWVATANGLNLLNRTSGRFARYLQESDQAKGLVDDNTISLFQDRSGILWVGTRSGGVAKWNPRTWSFGHYQPVVEDNADARLTNITALAEAGHSGVWFGTFGAGLVELDGAREIVRALSQSTTPAISDNRVMAMAPERSGGLWIGTMGGGLNYFDPQSDSVTVYRNDPDDPGTVSSDAIMSLFLDSRQRLWVGTYGGGLSRLDAPGRDFIHFPHESKNPNSLSGDRATAIVEDRLGRIWVGTEKHGLNRLAADGESWEQVVLRDAPNADSSGGVSSIYSLRVDPRGTLWVGTRAGLARVNAPDGPIGNIVIQWISEADNLPDDNVYGVEVDDLGRLWVSTGRGLSVITPDGKSIKNYFTSHGLQGREFNFGAHARGSDGTMYFGGNNGFNGFRPGELAINRQPPNVVLTGLRKLNREIRPSGIYSSNEALSLTHTDDVVTFEFAALDFAEPRANRYSYQLEGFDEGWVDGGTTHRTTYTNLAGGDYTFKVRAANSDGVWGESSLSLAIAVANPPWKTPIAYVIYAVIAASALIAFWYAQLIRLRREEQYSRRLEQEVSERTHELAERNSDLQTANGKLHEASYTDMLTQLKNRRYFFEEIGGLIDKTLWPANADRRQADASTEFVFLMVDLDHFKPVNDTHGHVAGDQMLVQVAEALRSACRSADTVIRWGGDEFLVVARRTGADEASYLAERIRAAVASCVFALGNGQVARTTSSIGYASFPFFDHKPAMVSWEQVLKIADLSMYVSKAQRNAWTGVTGVDYDHGTDSLMEELHQDISALHDSGNIIVSQSCPPDTGRITINQRI